MKKILLIAALAALSATAFGQNWLYTENVQQQAIEDMNVGLEKIRAAAKEAFKQQRIVNPLAKSLALKISENTYKKTFKTMEEQRYITNYPSGTFSIYGKFDVENDRVVYFCPQLGRVILKDFKTYKQYILFPKLKIYLEQDMVRTATSDVKTFLTVMPIPDFGKSHISDYNGFRALEQLGVIPATEASIEENVVEINGQKYETFVMPGHFFVKEGDEEYYAAIYVEAPINDGVNDGSKELLQWEEGQVDPANFVIPDGLDKAKDIKELNKKVKKAVADNNVGVEDPGYNPENIWDCFK